MNADHARPLRRLIPAFCVAIGLTTSLFAQPIARRMKATGGADGYRVAYERRFDRAALTRPDYEPADLTALASLLRLSDPQRDAFAVIIDRHVAAVADLPLELDFSDGTRPTFGSSAKTARGLLAGRLRSAGLDPALAENGTVQMVVGTAYFADPDDPDDPDAPRPPRAEVNVRLQPAEGVTLEAVTQATLDAVAAELEALLLPLEQARAEAQARADAAGLTPNDDLVLTRQSTSLKRAAIEAYQLQRRMRRDELHAELLPLLSESQLERWPIAERWRHRSLSLPWGALRGEHIDLRTLIEELIGNDDIQVEQETMPDVERLLSSWEILLGDALTRRDPLFMRVDKTISRATDARDADALIRAQRRLASAHRAVRDVTVDHLNALVALLGETNGATLRHTYLALAFPNFGRPTGADQSFGRALARDDLSPELLGAIGALDRQRRLEREQSDARLRERWHRDGPAVVLSAVAPVATLFDPECETDFDSLEILAGLSDERNAADTRWQEKLESLLRDAGTN